MIDLGENFISTIAGYIGDLFSNISPLIFIIIGIALAFWIIENIIKIVVRKKEAPERWTFNEEEIEEEEE